MDYYVETTPDEMVEPKEQDMFVSSCEGWSWKTIANNVRKAHLRA